jgi:ATPase subunit of ABC transporter with duplicated ATPase domains
MSYQPQIILQNVNYTTLDAKTIIKDLTLSFGLQKTAVVGRNGVGKSTLLKLIIDQLKPSSGYITVTGSLAFCPQNFTEYLNLTISEVLGVANKIKALDKVMNGSVDPADFDIIGDDWDLKSRIVAQLKNFGLVDMDFSRRLSSMSGGEITRLWLAKVFFTNSDFIILDEPTNNLDLSSKQLLYDVIKHWHKGLIVVSHDRNLLDLMEQIVELTVNGAQMYGGNYSAYIIQKEQMQTAVARQLSDAKKQLKKTKKAMQKTREKHDQRVAHGNRSRNSGGQAKLILDKMKESSGKTSGKLAIKEIRLQKQVEQQLQDAKAKTESAHKIKIELPKTYVPTGKLIAKLENISFSYPGQSQPVVIDFNLSIVGAERLALLGDNGSGKTTLIKLMQNILTPCSGEITLGTDRISYLDQNASILNSNLTVLDNYKRLNADINETQARFNLADFLFRGTDSLKLVADLSGGERLRAALACVLTATKPPQLLILDEPTNHLDLVSIAALESALNCYQGALIIISHDMQFIENIGVSKKINLTAKI